LLPLLLLLLLLLPTSHCPGDFAIEDSKRLCVYSLNTALSKLPEGKEQIMGLIDLRGIALSNIDLVFVAFMVDAFFVYYPRRCVPRSDCVQRKSSYAVPVLANSDELSIARVLWSDTSVRSVLCLSLQVGDLVCSSSIA
jgi:hypothetical protein